MNLRRRIALLMVLLTALPGLLAVILTRQLIDRSLDLGLSADVDAALQAGVEEARQHFEEQRRALQASASSLAAAWPGPQASADASVAALRRQRAALQGEWDNHDRVVLQEPNGEHHIVQAGNLSAIEHAPDPADAPPRVLRVDHRLANGWSLTCERATSREWRANATQLAETLQLVRGLRLQQKNLERSFWLPFLLIYGAAVVLALLLALRLGRGITSPVAELLQATDAVAGGDWRVQVPARSQDEIGRLTESFNAMVRTLDMQSQRLVDLEKMAGWREMARALAHEVKNPLTPIQLTVEEMRERYTGNDQEYRALLGECSRIVVEEVESLRGVVNRFREFSRPVALEPQAVDLNRLVQDVAALQRDLQVQLDLDDSIGEIELDADRMRQVLMNLAENARTATHVAPAPAMHLTTRAHPDGVEIFVEDNGPGIPASERQRIFEPYRSGTSGGLGLGLALVRGILLAHGGDISAVDGRGSGACMRIRLPRVAPREEARQPHASNETADTDQEMT